MVVSRRGPYLTKAAFGNQALVAHRVPERAAERARIRSPVEDGPHHFHFAGTGVTMFADVTVEAQGPVVPCLTHSLLLQKVNGKNRCVPAVSAPYRARAIFQLRERSNRPPGPRYVPAHPAQI